MKFKVIDLFSGIGGFSYGLEATGHFETVAFCEIEEFPRKVLKKHWQNVPIYKDIKDVTKERLRTDGVISNGDRIVVTGGFPCQDISIAGHQKGITGKRSGLWSELHRLIGEIQPDYAIMENVPNLLSGDRGRWFGRVLGDLSEIGFDARWYSIQASDMGAPHKRNRIWIIAYPNSRLCRGGGAIGQSGEDKEWGLYSEKEEQATHDLRSKTIGCDTVRGKKENVADSVRQRLERHGDNRESEKRVPQETIPIISSNDESRESTKQRSIESEICRMDDGLSNELDRHPGFDTEPNIPRLTTRKKDWNNRIKCLGNSILPQIATLLGETIIRHESEKK